MRDLVNCPCRAFEQEREGEGRVCLRQQMTSHSESSQKFQYNLGTWKGRTVCVGTIPAKQKNKP
jgi:hypothetical protein